ncbi:hypothetical protein RDWZM_000681 [Blomia tropicalis]|uniref:VWFC domain-containing protein n=1 Tax=Blomia tropicalis TaxID=40697 RepID=A0A9Q0MA66_BLOTA|nr:hypothetical protein RDWZM_000681 [Blomia tropicalis]
MERIMFNGATTIALTALLFTMLLNYTTDCYPLHMRLSRSKRAFSYIANETACMVDHIVYRGGDPIPTDDPCETCRCRPPGFSCVLRECEVKTGCRAIRHSGECCPLYQCGCEHNGRYYRDGERIPNAESPCYSCYCQGSSITCSLANCKFRFDCEPDYILGECCPRYDHCPPEWDENAIMVKSTEVPRLASSIFMSSTPSSAMTETIATNLGIESESTSNSDQVHLNEEPKSITTTPSIWTQDHQQRTTTNKPSTMNDEVSTTEKGEEQFEISTSTPAFVQDITTTESASAKYDDVPSRNESQLDDADMYQMASLLTTESSSLIDEMSNESTTMTDMIITDTDSTTQQEQMVHDISTSTVQPSMAIESKTEQEESEKSTTENNNSNLFYLPLEETETLTSNVNVSTEFSIETTTVVSVGTLHSIVENNSTIKSESTTTSEGAETFHKESDPTTTISPLNLSETVTQMNDPIDSTAMRVDDESLTTIEPMKTFQTTTTPNDDGTIEKSNIMINITEVST